MAGFSPVKDGIIFSRFHLFFYIDIVSGKQDLSIFRNK